MTLSGDAEWPKVADPVIEAHFFVQECRSQCRALAKHTGEKDQVEILMHQNHREQSSLGLLVFVMLQVPASLWHRRGDLSDSCRISSHVSLEDVPFLPDVFMKKG
jgi:hypothetical protein